MHVARRALALSILWGAACALPCCTLARSLDDLQGGTAPAAGSSGSAGSPAGAGQGGNAQAGEDAGGASAGMPSAGDAGAAGAEPTLPHLISPVSDGGIGWMAFDVQFDESMNADSISVPVGSALCTGSTLQLSKDGFKTCVEMSGPPTLSKNDSVVTLSPVNRLTVNGAYRLRVTERVRSQAGVASALTDIPVKALYSHSIPQTDNANHFLPEEQLATKTAGYQLFMAWDSNKLYLGMDGQSVSDNLATTLFVAYVGSGAGSKVGKTFGGKTASLSFEASSGLVWYGDNQPNKAVSSLTYDNTAWSATVQTGTARRIGNFVQFALPWPAELAASVGTSTASAAFASGMLNLSGTDYATTPSDSFTAKGHLLLDLSGKSLPKNAQVIAP